MSGEGSGPLLPYADAAALPADLRERYGARAEGNLARMWLNSPPSFAAGFEFVWTHLGEELKLDPAHRELVILLVARIEGGVYEWARHEPLSARAGVTPAQLDALKTLRLDAPDFGPVERILLRLVLEVARDVAASAEAVELAKRCFSAQEIVEVIILTGFYMTMARLTETTRTEVDPPPGVRTPTFHRVADADLPKGFAAA
jgi:alkylhydroperoxidase family enzyme